MANPALVFGSIPRRYPLQRQQETSRQYDPCLCEHCLSSASLPESERRARRAMKIREAAIVRKTLFRSL